MTMENIRGNLSDINKKISAAALKSGRNPQDILLLAVSKTLPAEVVTEASRAGQVHFGENRVQEARDKIPLLPDDLVWHLVGHLQSNKVKYCPELFGWIHSIDSVRLAGEVARRYREKGKVCRVLVQVSVSGEDVKFGCSPEDTQGVLSVLLEEDGTEPVGLMTMPPFSADPEDSRPYFAALQDLREDLVEKGFPADSLSELSMGMTGDFEVAIEEGATIIRVGTAIFGPRSLSENLHQAPG